MSCVVGWVDELLLSSTVVPALSIANSRSLFKLTSFELMMTSNHLILCHPLLFLPSIFPSIRVFSNESVLCIKWPKYWSFSFNISPSNEYAGLISFRMDWLDLLEIANLKIQNRQCDAKGWILGGGAWHWEEANPAQNPDIQSESPELWPLILRYSSQRV